jgi:hypothetical protein
MIIYSEKVTPYVIKIIRSSTAFIATITKTFVKSDKCFKECQIADLFQKPMYALVMKGVKLGRFEQFPWRKIYDLKDLSEILNATNDIRKDLVFLKAVEEYG